MSHRDPNQSLERPIEDILSGMHRFVTATRNRISSGEWSEEHLEKLNKIRKQFIDLEIALEILKEETW